MELSTSTVQYLMTSGFLYGVSFITPILLGFFILFRVNDVCSYWFHWEFVEKDI